MIKTFIDPDYIYPFEGPSLIDLVSLERGLWDEERGLWDEIDIDVYIEKNPFLDGQEESGFVIEAHIDPDSHIANFSAELNEEDSIAFAKAILKGVQLAWPQKLQEVKDSVI